jgi:hypothetical protein
MADSAETPKPSESTEIVVRNSGGKSFSTRIKGPDGKFQKKERPMPSGREFKRIGRKIFLKAAAEGNVTKYQLAVETLIGYASYDGTDAKLRGVAVQAFKVLTKQLGLEATATDEELEAMQVSGVKIVLVQPDSIVMAREPKNTETQKPDKPAFLEAEIVKQN